MCSVTITKLIHNPKSSIPNEIVSSNVLHPPSELQNSNEVKQMGKEISIVPHAVLLCLRFKYGLE